MNIGDIVKDNFGSLYYISEILTEDRKHVLHGKAIYKGINLFDSFGNKKVFYEKNPPVKVTDEELDKKIEESLENILLRFELSDTNHVNFYASDESLSIFGENDNYIYLTKEEVIQLKDLLNREIN